MKKVRGILKIICHLAFTVPLVVIGILALTWDPGQNGDGDALFDFVIFVVVAIIAVGGNVGIHQWFKEYEIKFKSIK